MTEILHDADWGRYIAALQVAAERGAEASGQSSGYAMDVVQILIRDREGLRAIADAAACVDRIYGGNACGDPLCDLPECQAPPQFRALRAALEGYKVTQRCPVCHGRTIVPQGFYSGTGPTITTAGVMFEKCRSCHGTGIVWYREPTP